MSKDDKHLIAALEKNACSVGESLREYDDIVDAAADKQVVLLGEATHGTHEFYRARAELSQRLIIEQGYNTIAVEADWPDAYAINRYVSGLYPGTTARAALDHFERFPTWMWANHDVQHFITWLRAYNELYACKARPIGFYGLDLYSMSTSIHAVIAYLEKTDPESAAVARERYSCLDHFMENPQSYGLAMTLGLTDSCENEIIAQLVDIRKKSYQYMVKDGLLAADEYFCAEQNAKVVCNAEKYYRAMFSNKNTSRQNLWNMRDQHMFETYQALAGYLSEKSYKPAKTIIWAHNSHIGNAAATEMSRRGEFNIGQLARETYGDKALLIGFSTAEGSVTAASNWDAPARSKTVRPPIPGSYEDIFHQVNQKNFLINLREENDVTDLLLSPRLQRAIGVIYRPDTERESHYFEAILPEQFDYLIHFNTTTAVVPLAVTPHWHQGELDETYPSGL
ncbi:erythromycin esterase family protein [Paremcibacter congregatus]|uniref:erythromycin esterase family protein n=1 Tax=Paremcibacter congregatus TaxID=2043170 RepID=UPI0030ECD80B